MRLRPRFTKGGKGKSRWRLLAPALFALALAFLPLKESHGGTCCVSTPAETFTESAAEVGYIAGIIADIGQLYAGVQSIIGTFKDYAEGLFGDVMDAFSDATVMSLALGSDIEVNIMTGLADNWEAVKGMDHTANIAAESVVPKDSAARVCNLDILRQGLVQTHVPSPWARSFYSALLSLGRGRHAGSVQYAADVATMRCPPTSGIFKNYPRTMSSLDGAPPECVEPEPGSGKAGAPAEGERSLVNADISASTLDGGQILEMPPTKEMTDPVTGEKVVMANPDANSRPQKFWIAAKNFCFNLGGPRPIAPSGEALKTPRGKAAKAQYDHCLALLSPHLKACEERVDRLTRPVCPATDSNPDIKKINAALCLESKRACLAAKRADVAVPPGVDLNKCAEGKEGLSPYQREYIAYLACADSKHYQDAAMAGVKHSVLLEQSDQCDRLITQWENQNIKEESSFVNAMRGVLKMGSCWASVPQISAVSALEENKMSVSYQSKKDADEDKEQQNSADKGL